jgi:ribosomal protein S18 acetylase RimI-like enzyme
MTTFKYVRTEGTIRVGILLNGEEVATGTLYHDMNANENAPGIWSVLVHDKHQGKGYGRKIMEELISEAIVLGLPYVFLTVNKENYRAINLYASLGFRISGQYALRSSSWVMRKTMEG